MFDYDLIKLNSNEYRTQNIISTLKYSNKDKIKEITANVLVGITANVISAGAAVYLSENNVISFILKYLLFLLLSWLIYYISKKIYYIFLNPSGTQKRLGDLVSTYETIIYKYIITAIGFESQIDSNTNFSMQCYLYNQAFYYLKTVSEWFSDSNLLLDQNDESSISFIEQINTIGFYKIIIDSEDVFNKIFVFFRNKYIPYVLIEFGIEQKVIDDYLPLPPIEQINLLQQYDILQEEFRIVENQKNDWLKKMSIAKSVYNKMPSEKTSKGIGNL